MDTNQTSRLQDLNRQILLANGEYNDLLQRVEVMLNSLNASELLLRDNVKRIGEKIRNLKTEVDTELNGEKSQTTN